MIRTRPAINHTNIWLETNGDCIKSQMLGPNNQPCNLLETHDKIIRGRAEPHRIAPLNITYNIFHSTDIHSVTLCDKMHYLIQIQEHQVCQHDYSCLMEFIRGLSYDKSLKFEEHNRNCSVRNAGMLSSQPSVSIRRVVAQRCIMWLVFHYVAVWKLQVSLNWVP